MYIDSLHIYPIKSCQGIDLRQAELVATGLQYDRHWMLVNPQGVFLSQRELPHMALIKTELTDSSLIVSDGRQQSLQIPIQASSSRRKSVQIWNDRCSAAIVSAEASRWFSNSLKTECELVFLPTTEQRLVDPEYAQNSQIVGFADGFPLLVVSKASIDLLNNKLGEQLDIGRFRPNIVLEGCPAHAEDDWSAIAIGDITIQLAKLCSRCVIPSIDQQNAQKHPGILKTLASYRRRDGKVYVGQNGLHDRHGLLKVGQTVDIIGH